MLNTDTVLCILTVHGFIIVIAKVFLSFDNPPKYFVYIFHTFTHPHTYTQMKWDDRKVETVNV